MNRRGPVREPSDSLTATPRHPAAILCASASASASASSRYNIYTQDLQTLNPKRASCGIRPGEKHRPGASRPPYGAWTLSVGPPYGPRPLSVRLMVISHIWCCCRRTVLRSAVCIWDFYKSYGFAGCGSSVHKCYEVRTAIVKVMK